MLRDLVLAALGVLWVIILALVGGRFLVLLFDANRDSEIVDRILRHSDFWVKPFFDILGLADKAVEETGGVFEPASLIAFIVYFIVGSLILGGLRAAFSSGRGVYHHA
jgi:hypothetical protein